MKDFVKNRTRGYALEECYMFCTDGKKNYWVVKDGELTKCDFLYDSDFHYIAPYASLLQ